DAHSSGAETKQAFLAPEAVQAGLPRAALALTHAGRVIAPGAIDAAGAIALLAEHRHRLAFRGADVVRMREGTAQPRCAFQPGRTRAPHRPRSGGDPCTSVPVEIERVTRVAARRIQLPVRCEALSGGVAIEDHCRK